MKTLFMGLLIASLSLTLTGCGKDGGGGGGVSPTNISLSGLTGYSAQAITDINSWYNGTTEGSAQAAQVVTVTKTAYTSTSSQQDPYQNCTQKSVSIFGKEFSYYYCSNSTSTTQPQGTVVSGPIQVNLTNTNTLPISQKGNAELNSIFNGSLGQPLGAQSYGTQTSIDFLRADGTIVTYIIDRNYHSLLNPVKKIERTATQQITTIVTAQRIY